MKTSLFVFAALLINSYSYSQTADSVGVIHSRSRVFGAPSQEASAMSLNGLHSQGWWRIASKENISFKTSNMQLSAVEDKMTDLESEECSALKNRDTLTLIRIWARDFTQDGKQNKIVDNKNGLPNYLSLHRMIESIAEMDSNTVYISGDEVFREIKTTEKSAEATRRFFHIWTRKNGIWKLTTKRFD